MRRSRTTPPSRCRAAPTTAASRSRNGRRWAAARTATSRRIPPIPTSSTPPITTGCTATTARTKQVRDISPNPETHYGWGAADINFRFWWTFPVMVSPHDPKTLYVTSQVVHRTRNEGQSWEVISPDLTRADPKTLEKTPSYMSPRRASSGDRSRARPTARSGTPRSSRSPSRRSRRACCGRAPTTASCRCRATTARRGRRSRRPDLPEFALISIIDPSPHDAGDGLRRGHPLQAAGQQAVSLQDVGLREDVDEDRRRHPPPTTSPA